MNRLTINTFVVALILFFFFCSKPGKSYHPGEYEKLTTLDSQIEYINSLSQKDKIIFFKEVLSKKSYYMPPRVYIKYEPDGLMIIGYIGGGSIPEYYECNWTVKNNRIIFSRPSKTKELPYDDDNLIIGGWDDLAAEKFDPDNKET